MNSKLTSSSTTKRTNAIFLAIVLIGGTFAAISPSFMTTEAAQAQPYYDERNSYEPTVKDYGMDDNSYESDYGIDNDRKSYRTDSYEPTVKDYENDNSYDNKKSYETNSYEPTVKDYGLDDNSYQKTYGKDNNNNNNYYKTQKDSSSSKSASINKINCINTNININGNNTGDVNLGNKGQGYSGTYSSADSGYSGGYDGYSKKDKGFDCVINNNNNNTNVIVGGGNVTKPTATLEVTKVITCNPIPIDISPGATEACLAIENTISPSDFNIIVTGNEPFPDEFPGSNNQPVVVTLGAGDYRVTEELPNLPTPPTGISISRTTTFSGECTDVDPSNPESIVAAGTIEAGESQTCDIVNLYEAREIK